MICFAQRRKVPLRGKGLNREWRFLDNLNERRLLFFIRMKHRFLTMGAHF
jgi:hypothetical protein